MKTTARVLLCVGLLCFVPLFYPSHRHTPIENGTEERFTLGLPQSPWFVHSSTETKIEVKQNGVSSSSTNSAFSTNVEFISWSSLFAIVGTSLIVVRRH